MGSPHDFSATGPWTTTLGKGGACSPCHLPHGAADDLSLWPRSLGVASSSGYRYYLKSADGTDDNNFQQPVTLQCYDCHDYAGISGTPFTGDGASVASEQNLLDGGTSAPLKGAFTVKHRPQDIAFGMNYRGITLPPSSDYGFDGAWTDDFPGGSIAGFFETSPPNSSPARDEINFGVKNPPTQATAGGHYFRSGDPLFTGSPKIVRGDKIPCNDCHDVHDDTNQAFMKKNLAGTALTDIKASSYMSNRAPSPKLRDNADSRKFCNACHTLAGSEAAKTYYNVNPLYESTNFVQRPVSIAEHLVSSSAACTQCHSHNSIFASCSQCHGYPPSSTATPAYPTSPRFIPTSTNITGTLKDPHIRHYGAASGNLRDGIYQFDCDTCHYGSSGTGAALGNHQDNKVSVLIEATWTKAANIPNTTSPVADNTNYFVFAKFPTYPTAKPPVAQTGNLDNTNGNYGWGNSTTYGGNTCRNVYCHSAGRITRSMPADCTWFFRPVTWDNGVQHCNDCHGGYANGAYPAGTITDSLTNGGRDYGMPNYPSGTVGSDNANSHVIHVSGNNYECYLCHAATVTTASTVSRAILATSPSLHVNGVRNVDFGNGVTGTYDNVNKTCSVSCHGGSPVQWGGTLPQGCFACHAGTEQIYKPRDDYGTTGTPNPVDNDQYLTRGHGRIGPVSNTYPVTGNNPAMFSTYTGATSSNSCYLCHSSTAAHTTKNSNDPFRLGYGTDNTGQNGSLKGAFADNTDRLCLGCHGSDAERLGHDNVATGTTTLNAQTHAWGITGTNYSASSSSWPVNPWKCVDCHDPHGDSNIAMVRSGMNAPTVSNDTLAGSDSKSRTKRTTVDAITFTSESGYAAGSYAISGAATRGICEVCHTQTKTFARSGTYADNAGTHATRIGNCVTCHPHNAGFAAKACNGCHGPDGNTSNAPNVGAYWYSSGHGLYGSSCEGCHDTGLLAGDPVHDTNLTGTPPANTNTLVYPGMTVNANTIPGRNTAHLKAMFISITPPTYTAPTSRAALAKAFDSACYGPSTGCHASGTGSHFHQKKSVPDNAMKFDATNNPAVKTSGWYNLSLYQTDYDNNFFATPGVWCDNDISNLGLVDNTYGLCISCHDPHGTATTNTTEKIHDSNHMLRGNWVSPYTNQFCATACHK